MGNYLWSSSGEVPALHKKIQERWLIAISNGSKKAECSSKKDEWNDIKIGQKILFSAGEPEAKTAPVLTEVTAVKVFKTYADVLMDSGGILLPGVDLASQGAEICRDAIPNTKAS